MSRTAKFVLSRKQEYIEEVGSIDEQIAALKLRRDKLVSRLQKYPGKTPGVVFTCNVYTRTHSSLNTAKVKKLLGETKYAACLRTQEITVVSVRRI